MKKMIAVLLIAVIILGGCVKFDGIEVERNLYEQEIILEQKFGNVSFNIPESWENQNKEGFDYYYKDDDLILAFQKQDTNLTNIEFIDSYDEFSTELKERENISGEINVSSTLIDGTDTLEITSVVDDKIYGDFYFRCLAFVSQGKRYIFTNYARESSYNGYQLEYQRLKDSIEILLPKLIEIEEGQIYFTNMYLVEEKSTHGYEGWVIAEFDLSMLDEDSQYWVEKEYSFDLDDDSDGDDEKYLHLESGRTYESGIQPNGRKYIFAKIEESKEPISELNLSLDMGVWCYKKLSDHSYIIGNGSDFNILSEIPNGIYEVMEDVLTDYLNIYKEIYGN